MNKIDFVILWVDGNDKKWLEEKKLYKPDINVDDAVNRYRDFGILKYWFRGVEKFAPWVNHIYFVTYGHLPNFLNINNPKITIVNHKDIMKDDYLPTYNSNAIELNVGNIKGLSDQFVLFNDDMFLIKPVKEKDFFDKGLPKDEYAETVILANNDMIQYTLLNNANVINKHYKKKKVYVKHPFKYFNYKYGINLIRTFFLLPYHNFTGFYYNHIPQPYLKKYFFDLWKKEPLLCENTSLAKFRSKDDITHWLVKVMQMLSGNFAPQSHSFGKYYSLDNENDELINCIKKQKHKTICINDAKLNINFAKTQKELIEAFEVILPDKSSFEK